MLSNVLPEYVLLDVNLPGRSGMELLREIRTRFPATRVVMITGYAAVDLAVEAMKLGAYDYIPKPFSPRELAARVKAVLRRFPSGENAPSAARVDSPFLVDKKRMAIRFFGKPLDLSRYEFRILEVLIGRPGWVFSREQLMDLVWEAPESSMDRTVDTHVKTIRAKLRAIKPEADPIQTHRGVGYSLKESW